ncbi:ABC transporter ATP-binding protein [Aquibium sp. A9E412]|uniref:ABC transporter ATP-binding protein n=1 Tax=Aquibium sp. A9E412 TaxID=2976767 RepID=UPI0025B0EAF5|nr:ABC transporter ATP-binding protein [Aquibium sp. A9E412]MDN2566120.1 ABC transporter ATP-binding protein [Aquibium sp. A9E412]
MASPALRVHDLTVELGGVGRILDGVSFELPRGQTLGIVGESGCGKSMTALAVMQLMPSPALRITAGEIEVAGESMLRASERRRRAMRGSELAMIFQDPMTSLNPLYTVGDQIVESIRKNEAMPRRRAMARAGELLGAVGIPDPERHLREYPHQLSGGKRQRVMIAMALAGDPGLLIADEPTTALDVTVQAQIFDVLRAMQARLGTAIMMITHDMGAVAEMADRVVVMYAGRVVEEGPVGDILTAPRHPYTRGLIACIPHMADRTFDEWPELPAIAGTVPELADRRHGCAFAPRCPLADRHCAEAAPPLAGAPGWRSACWKDPIGARQ